MLGTVRRLLFDKATQANGAGTAAALYLARMLIWPTDGDSETERPPEKAAASDALHRLSPSERERLAEIMLKLGVDINQ